MITKVSSFDNFMLVNFDQILISPFIAHGDDYVFGGGGGDCGNILLSFAIHD